jgi:hypothetical protein
MAWAAPLPVLAQPACVRPDLNNFLEQSRAAIGFNGSYYPAPSAKFLPLQGGGNGLQWMGASWEAPPDGALFVIDCAGHRVAALRLGQIETLRAGPDISGFGKTVEVIYTAGTGTGVDWRKVSLVAFSTGAIAVLWTHDAYEFVDLPTLQSYTNRYVWRYADDGTVIHVTGKHVINADSDEDQDTAHPFPREAFCWQEKRLSYASCKAE